MNTHKERIKRDRSARLIRLVNVLYQNPQGLPVSTIAEKCCVFLHTAYRDFLTTPIIQETLWHPSQKLESKKGGSLILTLNVVNSMELRSWIMGWGERVIFLQPASLLQKITCSAMKMVGLYGVK